MSKPTVTIKLTGRSPVEIDPTEWPVICRGSVGERSRDHDYVEFTLRQHSDGRILAYGRAGTEATGTLHFVGWLVNDMEHARQKLHDACQEMKDIAVTFHHPKVALQRMFDDLPPEVT